MLAAGGKDHKQSWAKGKIRKGRGRRGLNSEKQAAWLAWYCMQLRPGDRAGRAEILPRLPRLQTNRILASSHARAFSGTQCLASLSRCTMCHVFVRVRGGGGINLDFYLWPSRREHTERDEACDI